MREDGSGRLFLYTLVATSFGTVGACGAATGVSLGSNGTVGSDEAGHTATPDPMSGDSMSGAVELADAPSGSVATDSGSSPSLSCAPGGPGLTNCGANEESCCTSLEVTGGTYFRSYDDDVGYNMTPVVDTNGGPTAESDPATVSDFRLDKYLVTVGRFRQFVTAWGDGAGYVPPPGSGKHAYLYGGKGLENAVPPGGHETGWLASYDSRVTPTDERLACLNGGSYATWTATTASQEDLPIDCVNWYESYAFCIWDGGFLPSAAEWEYAAAGGSQQRAYPWGSTAPGMSSQYAIYGNGSSVCFYPNLGGSVCTGVANIAPVGTAALGAGLWGQLDMAGELSEWTLDTYVGDMSPCVDCGDLSGTSDRAVRGGNFMYGILPPPGNDGGAPGMRGFVGFRCARAP